MPAAIFSSFRSRILLFVIGLLVVVQGSALLAVHVTNLSGARRHIGEALELTAASFRRSLAAREGILLEKARLLSADFAFKQVLATRDAATVHSALENHRSRIGGDVMLLLDLSGRIRADTLPGDPRARAGELAPLLARARANEFGEASSIERLEGVPYQLVVVPVFTPEPAAWIVVGFEIRDAFAHELQSETGTQVSLLAPGDGGWRAFCTTLEEPARSELARVIGAPDTHAARVVDLELGGERFISWVAPLDDTGPEVVAVLQRSLDEALQPFLELRTGLLVIFLAGVGLSIAGSALLASRVTRPVAALARAARRIERGDYGKPVVVNQRDELGLLASAFNAMTRGLAERDRVRDLLGRVVAPEVAEELLRGKLELGGEERVVSLFFADIRGFTGLAEREDPQRLISMLNVFLTAISAEVEAQDGVVDEYLGDGAKAIFGAPITRTDHATRAVRAALALRDRMPAVNAEISSLGARPLEIGIGVNTAEVVAGRMGSLSRLKYTVVGDGVNVAARLESLTRRYGVPIITSESTWERCTGVVFRQLDRVRVHGRATPLSIFEPMAIEDDAALPTTSLLEAHREGLACFQAGDRAGAERIFRELLEHEPPSGLYRHYLDRIERRPGALPLPVDGVTTIDEK